MLTLTQIQRVNDDFEPGATMLKMVRFGHPVPFYALYLGVKDNLLLYDKGDGQESILLQDDTAGIFGFELIRPHDVVLELNAARQGLLDAVSALVDALGIPAEEPLRKQLGV